MKQHILILSGISGSGKTTRARNLCSTKGYIRVNRDEIRQMLFGYTEEDSHIYYSLPGIQHREALVTFVQHRSIQGILDLGKSVVVDNTNLKMKHIKGFEVYDVPLRYELVDCPVEVAIQRDKNRSRSVGEQIIRKQKKNLDTLVKSGIFDIK